MSHFSAYLALSTAHEKLRMLTDDVEGFTGVLALLKDAIPASKDEGTAEDALDLCKRALERFNEEITERYSDDGQYLFPRAGETAQIVRGALYHAAVELRSTLRQPQPVGRPGQAAGSRS